MHVSESGIRRSLSTFACVMLTTLTMLTVAAGSVARAQVENFTPVTDAMLQDPDPADWLMWRRTLDSWGYSPLDQITRQNVDQIRLVWTRAMMPGTQEGTPLVYDGVMYMPNPRDVIQAIDAVTGDLTWEYRRDLPDDLEEYMFQTAVTRNIAIYDRLIIDTSADDYVYALDAASGRLVWETQVLDYQEHPANQTSWPDHRQRQSRVRSQLYAEGWSGGMRHHRTRREDWGGAVAQADDSRTRRTRRRNLGRCPLRGAQPRRRLDGSQL